MCISVLCRDMGLDTSAATNLPLLTRESYMLARVAAEPGGAQGAFTVEVVRVASFFSCEVPGSYIDEPPQYFANVHWLAAPMASRNDASGRLYPRCTRSGIPIVYTEHYRTHASVGDGFLVSIWPLQAMLPEPVSLVPLDEYHDVPRGLCSRGTGRTDKAVPQQLLEKYGCGGSKGFVPGAAGDPAVQVRFGVRLAQQQRATTGAHAQRGRGRGAGGSRSAGRGGHNADASDGMIRTPLLSAVLVPFRKLYDHFN